MLEDINCQIKRAIIGINALLMFVIVKEVYAAETYLMLST